MRASRFPKSMPRLKCSECTAWLANKRQGRKWTNGSLLCLKCYKDKQNISEVSSLPQDSYARSKREQMLSLAGGSEHSKGRVHTSLLSISNRY